MRIIRRDKVVDFLARLLARMIARDASLLQQCSEIIDDVRRRGDEALIDYTRQFDGVELTELRISDEALRRSAEKADSRVVEALGLAIENVRTFHERQVERVTGLYQRAGEGKADDVAAKVRAEGGVPDTQVIGDTEGAAQWLRMQPWLNGKVGCIGTCSGGRASAKVVKSRKSQNITVAVRRCPPRRRSSPACRSVKP